MLDNTKFLEFILKCENKYPVDSWIIGNIEVWPLIRCFVFREIMKTNNNRRINTKNFIKNASGRLTHTVNFWRDWKKNIIPFSKVDILFLGNGITKSLFEGKWYDYIIQPIMDEYLNLGYKCHCIERGLFYRYPRSTNSFLTRGFEEIACLLATIISFFIPLKTHLPSIEGFLFDLQQLEKEAAKKLSIPSIKRYALCVKFIAHFYSLILFITKPQVVYISCYYTMSGTAMCYACSKKNIPSVEIQHGNIHNNFAYCGWKKAPEKGYNSLPKIFWLWTTDDQKEFKKRNSKSFLKSCKAFVGGTPWMYFWQSNNLVVQKYINLLKLGSNNAKLNILVTLRPDIFGNSNWDDLSKLIKQTPNEICWWIRKHPTTNTNTEPSLKAICEIKKWNVNYELASRLPLFSLLRFVDLHITTASNVAVEAKLFNVGTIFISELARAEMPFLIDNKNIKIETSMDNLRKILLHDLIKKGQ